MSLNIHIVGYGIVKNPRLNEFSVFIMKIEENEKNQWTIYRRLETFGVLSEQLQLCFTNVPLCPVLIHAGIDELNLSLMEDIGKKLNAWMIQLIQFPMVLQSEQFQEFLTTESNLTPPGLHPHRFNFSNGVDLGEMNMEDLYSSMNEEELTNNFYSSSVEMASSLPSASPYQNSHMMLVGKERELERQRQLERQRDGITTSSSTGTTGSSNQKVQLEDFSRIKVIGKGSFGKVMLVRKGDSGKIYAMKMLRKENIIKRNQVEHTRTERQVLGYVRHPYIVGLNYAFQTTDKLFFVLDYCAGGELFFHLGKVQRFNEARARFYAAEITLALEYIHGLDIIYRDLKPENVLLDENGHIKLTDFGLSKEGIQDNFSGAHSFCGTPEYLAPEILNRSGHGRAVDWWSLGALLYEMLTGLPPFYSRDRNKLFDKIRRGQLSYPKYLSESSKSLLKGLLERDPTKRLGTGTDDANAIKQHPFFESINWHDLMQGKVQTPWKPTFKSSLDTSQFDHEFTSMPIESPVRPSHLTALESDSLFQGFTYTEESRFKERIRSMGSGVGRERTRSSQFSNGGIDHSSDEENDDERHRVMEDGNMEFMMDDI